MGEPLTREVAEGLARKVNDMLRELGLSLDDVARQVLTLAGRIAKIANRIPAKLDRAAGMDERTVWRREQKRRNRRRALARSKRNNRTLKKEGRCR